MTKLEMDLLDLLREDCRLPLEKLAVMLGATTEEVAATVDRLEEERVILHYAPTINWDKTDRERVEAMIQVSVTPQRDKGFDEVARRINEHLSDKVEWMSFREIMELVLADKESYPKPNFD